MIEISVHNDIANEKEGIYMSMFGFENSVFSLDTVKSIFSDNKEETDFKLNIHCDGGSVSEGLAIYDYLRTSGKNIHANIEGKCHSMAVTLLLAAPFENRTANKNATALVHEVRGFIPDYATADEMKEYSDSIIEDQQKIAKIYSERTGGEEDDMMALMKEEKEINAKRLKELGFISKINQYNTNLKTEKMADIKKFNENINKIMILLTKNEAPETVNADWMDAEGNVVFTTEGDTIEVGTTVTGEDGTYTLEDGREVTVEGGAITAINEATSEIDALKAEVEELKNTLAEKDTAINEQTEVINEAKELINSLKDSMTSKQEINQRTTTPKDVQVNPNEEVINKAKENIKKFKGGK